MIPVSQPYITQEDIDGITAVLKSGQLSNGPRQKEFEQRFEQLIGTKHAIAVNSGTSGLHLALRALGIQEGDEVITSPFSFIASANCILFEKAKPVFVDIEEDTFNINSSLIPEAITDKTRALLPVHIFGQSCDMESIMKIALMKDLRVVEDACESLGATHHKKKVGTFGDAAVFAFYPNKQMTTGEGGMIVTNNEEVAVACKSMRNQGRDPGIGQGNGTNGANRWLVHHRLGYNYRMTELSASLGCTQMDKLDFFTKQRKQIIKDYFVQLREIPEIILPKTKEENTHTWFVLPVRVQESIDRDSVVAGLLKRGVQTRNYFAPCIHLQPFYKKQFGFAEGSFPVAEKVSKSIFILPLYVRMTENDINTVIEALKEAIKEAQKK
jgi:perosamine synthetase